MTHINAATQVSYVFPFQVENLLKEELTAKDTLGALRADLEVKDKNVRQLEEQLEVKATLGKEHLSLLDELEKVQSTAIFLLFSTLDVCLSYIRGERFQEISWNLMKKEYQVVTSRIPFCQRMFNICKQQVYWSIAK